MFTSLSILLASVLVLTAGIWDLREAKIPNALTYPAVLVGMALGLYPDVNPSLMSSITGFAVAFLPALFLFAAVGGIGGGDVKLLAAVGALLGYPVVLDVLFYSIVAGSAMSLALIVWRGRLIETLQGLGWVVKSLVYKGVQPITPVRDMRIPFAVAVMIGTLWALYVPVLRVSPELTKLFGG